MAAKYAEGICGMFDSHVEAKPGYSKLRLHVISCILQYLRNRQLKVALGLAAGGRDIGKHARPGKFKVFAQRLGATGRTLIDDDVLWAHRRENVH